MSTPTGDPSVFQDTFQELVQQNIDDFEMEKEEAVADALQQLKSQGVDTHFIVVDERAAGLPALISQLVSATASSDADQPLQLPELLRQLQQFCSAGLAHRCLAGRRGAYTPLVAALESEPAAALHALATLQDGQPDIFQTTHTGRVLSLLDTHPEGALAWAAAVTLRHEANRQAMAEAGLLAALAARLRDPALERSLLPAICVLLRQMTTDDDVRVPYGKAHEHACRLVTEYGVLDALLQLLKGASEEPTLATELIHTCTKLCVRKEFCEQVAASGGAPVLLSAMRSNPKNAALTGRSFFFIRTLAGSDQVKDSLMKPEFGASEVMFSSLDGLKGKALVSEAAFAAIGSLTLRSPDNATALAEAGIIPCMVAAMEQHPADDKVQKLACMAVRNMASRSPELRVLFREEGVEALINAALQTHGEKVDAEGRAALRDLGCDVSLKEEWTGHGGALTTGLVKEPERPMQQNGQ